MNYNKFFHVKSGGDKIMHFLAGIFIFIFMFTALIFLRNMVNVNTFFTPEAYGIVAVVLIGAGKEIYDSKQEGNKFDFFDMFATYLGGIVTLFIIMGIMNFI